jgi:pyruvate/2-oxoglutarate dehydrogenase complex dihydrolipoamide dehydrogenase (E3) component
VGERSIHAKTFLISTGAKPAIPGIGLEAGGVPFLTYEQIFENDHLPETMIVVGGGPIGMEIAQAYQRLGSQVSIIAEQILPRDEPEVREVLHRVFGREGIRIVAGRALSAHRVGSKISVATTQGAVVADILLIASGRRPSVEDLDLEKAGVEYSERGIPVNRELRTNVKHIYAAGDVTGGPQFTHVAGWQAFQAVRNALLPGSSAGLTDLIPWVTFTDPEVAHAGLTEAQAREKFGDAVQTYRWNMNRTDRAICENDTDGFIKIVTRNDGVIAGATIVAGRAGEVITELLIAIQQGWKAEDLAGAIHVYPTYSTAVQQMAAEIALTNLLSGPSGRLLRGISKLIR